ncbi:MAG: hypothetical protein WAW91_01830 [Candidatus Nanoperiomorbaceae bacterium]
MDNPQVTVENLGYTINTAVWFIPSSTSAIQKDSLLGSYTSRPASKVNAIAVFPGASNEDPENGQYGYTYIDIYPGRRCASADSKMLITDASSMAVAVPLAGGGDAVFCQNAS